MTLHVLNLTPHHLVVFNEHNEPFVDRAPDGPPARVEEVRSGVVATPTDLGELPFLDVAYADEVSGLPAPQPDVRYLVSRVTAAALIGRRDDLLFPVDEVRNEQGMPIGCRALGRFVPLAEIEVPGAPAPVSHTPAPVRLPEE